MLDITLRDLMEFTDHRFPRHAVVSAPHGVRDIDAVKKLSFILVMASE